MNANWPNCTASGEPARHSDGPDGRRPGGRPQCRSGRAGWRCVVLPALLLLAAGGCAGSASEPVSKPGGGRDTGAGEGTGPRGTSDGGDRSSGAGTAIQFADITEQAGIDFRYRDGQAAGLFTMLETLGGGVAACDYDGDGAIDLIAAGGGGFTSDQQIVGLPPGCFRNDGRARFTAVGAQAGLTAASHYSHGVTAADMDNDGFPDLVITGYPTLAVYRNHGDGTFLAIDPRERGLDDPRWSSSAAWGDLDGDGNLDLYVVHYVDWSFENNPNCRGAADGQRDLCTPKSFGGLSDALFLSDGAGRYREAGGHVGLQPGGKGLGVVLADLDDDGQLDIYVANDTTPNFLYRNAGGLQLEEIGQLSGTNVNDRGDPDGSMGVAVLDYNLDGLPDLWVTDFEDEIPALYRNLGHGLFRHVSRVTGVAAAGGMYVGWGTVAADFDRDGDEDLFVTNGHAVRHARRAPLQQRPQLFENIRGEQFVNVTAGAGAALQVEHLGRGLATADFDGDGDLDLALTPINEPLSLLANVSTGAGNWIGFRLSGRVSNRDAIGARITLATAGGTQVRQVVGGGGYASTSDRLLVFGLGAETEVTRATIRWPSGREQVLEAPASGQVLRLTEP